MSGRFLLKRGIGPLAYLLALGLSLAGIYGCVQRRFNPSKALVKVDRSGALYDRVVAPQALMDLENAGFHIGAMLPGTRGLAVNNKELFERNDAYSGIVATIAADVQARRTRDPSLGVNTAHRTVDERMLTSPEATYELVGVMNRTDLSLQFQGLCTAVRFIYRLAYSHDHLGRMDSSRMPMTLAINYRVAGLTSLQCAAYTLRWRGPQTVEALAAKDGPLAADTISRANFQSVELNIQLQTWPSSAAQAMGAFGEYIFRVFDVDPAGKTATPKPLSNTIDVARINSDPSLKKELGTFLLTNLNAIARGTVNIPQKFLATSISAFTPGGLSRLSNRPFSQIFAAADFRSADFKSTRYLHSPEELMTRLNDLTCSGCHSGRAVNGFHQLGEERPNATHPHNTLFVGASEYGRNTRAERLKIMNVVASDLSTNDIDLPISVKPLPGGASYGSTCALDASAKRGGAYEGWNCQAGLVCRQTDEPKSETHLGKCFPAKLGTSGDPCNIGYTVENTDPTKERLEVTEFGTCGGISQCSNQGGGFPGGLCRRSCSEIDRASGLEACGPIASDGFNACLDDPSRTWVDCLSNNTDTNGRSLCDANRPCRNDYFCVKSVDSAKHGACVPSYFLFQLGMDAHPVLSASKSTKTLGFSPTPGLNQVRASPGAPSGQLLLKRRPIDSSLLAESEKCLMPASLTVGAARRANPISGHIALDLTTQSNDPTCRDFKGLVYVFKDHAEFF